MIYNSFEDAGFLKVLKFLKTHNTEYLSGQDLSDVLRISRVAVWKHIKKNSNFRIHSRIKTKRGIQTYKKFRFTITMGNYFRTRNKNNRSTSILL